MNYIWDPLKQKYVDLRKYPNVLKSYIKEFVNLQEGGSNTSASASASAASKPELKVIDCQTIDIYDLYNRSLLGNRKELNKHWANHIKLYHIYKNIMAATPESSRNIYYKKLNLIFTRMQELIAAGDVPADYTAELATGKEKILAPKLFNRDLNEGEVHKRLYQSGVAAKIGSIPSYEQATDRTRLDYKYNTIIRHPTEGPIELELNDPRGAEDRIKDAADIYAAMKQNSLTGLVKNGRTREHVLPTLAAFVGFRALTSLGLKSQDADWALYLWLGDCNGFLNTYRKTGLFNYDEMQKTADWIVDGKIKQKPYYSSFIRNGCACGESGCPGKSVNGKDIANYAACKGLPWNALWLNRYDTRNTKNQEVHQITGFFKINAGPKKTTLVLTPQDWRKKVAKITCWPAGLDYKLRRELSLLSFLNRFLNIFFRMIAPFLNLKKINDPNVSLKKIHKLIPTAEDTQKRLALSNLRSIHVMYNFDIAAVLCTEIMKDGVNFQITMLKMFSLIDNKYDLFTFQWILLVFIITRHTSMYDAFQTFIQDINNIDVVTGEHVYPIEGIINVVNGIIIPGLQKSRRRDDSIESLPQEVDKQWGGKPVKNYFQCQFEFSLKPNNMIEITRNNKKATTKTAREKWKKTKGGGIKYTEGVPKQLNIRVALANVLVYILELKRDGFSESEKNRLIFGIINGLTEELVQLQNQIDNLESREAAVQKQLEDLEQNAKFHENQAEVQIENLKSQIEKQKSEQATLMEDNKAKLKELETHAILIEEKAQAQIESYKSEIEKQAEARHALEKQIEELAKDSRARVDEFEDNELNEIKSVIDKYVSDFNVDPTDLAFELEDTLQTGKFVKDAHARENEVLLEFWRNMEIEDIMQVLTVNGEHVWYFLVDNFKVKGYGLDFFGTLIPFTVDDLWGMKNDFGKKFDLLITAKDMRNVIIKNPSDIKKIIANKDGDYDDEFQTWRENNQLEEDDDRLTELSTVFYNFLQKEARNAKLEERNKLFKKLARENPQLAKGIDLSSDDEEEEPVKSGFAKPRRQEDGGAGKGSPQPKPQFWQTLSGWMKEEEAEEEQQPAIIQEPTGLMFLSGKVNNDAQGISKPIVGRERSTPSTARLTSARARSASTRRRSASTRRRSASTRGRSASRKRRSARLIEMEQAQTELQSPRKTVRMNKSKNN